MGTHSYHLLGHIVDAMGSRVNPAKLIDCENWPKPTTGKHVQQFLGFVNYWRDNIPLLSSLTSRTSLAYGPLNTMRITIAFSRFYDSGTMLHHADFNYPFFGASDASGTGIGGCIYQIIDGTRYILFCSRSLSPAERNYSATKRELLALIYVIRKGRNYFYGAHFEFYTDHAALTYIHSQPKLHPMYNFTINHRPGILNILPDTLSRLYPEANRQYYVINRRVKIAPHSTTTIVEDKDDQLKMLEEKHLLGHFGATAMINAVRAAGYNWPQITEQATEIVQSCSKCQQFNIVRRGYHPTRPILSKMPGHHLAIDLAGPLPTTNRGNNYLFIAVDICTRFCFLRPMVDKTSATTVTHLIDYCTIFGFPRILQSDNGTEFVNGLMTILKETAGFDHRFITPYHAAANGTAERWVQNALNVIRMMIDGARHDWDLYVPSTQYALNVKIAARHGSTPFSLTFTGPDSKSLKGRRGVMSYLLSDIRPSPQEITDTPNNCPNYNGRRPHKCFAKNLQTDHRKQEFKSVVAECPHEVLMAEAEEEGFSNYRVVHRHFQLNTQSKSCQEAKDYGRDTWREQMSYIPNWECCKGHCQEQLNGLRITKQNTGGKHLVQGELYRNGL
ncbi:putative Reverse transcriptase [Planoprotostelium fungivorum]|uniref:Putative Reverse transcriptase n=1 Tax=Planoprotostelium fungivorum TaxID=1890364 RepID=A0A2P6MZA3_9EUKA|nr:putative Reverse transcriptase [Planoprotostelium fungivorum]